MRPHFSLANAGIFIHTHYAFTPTSINPLVSDRDQNFKAVAPDGATYVLKIANSDEDVEVLTAQNKMMALLARENAGITPHPIPNQNGDFITPVVAPDGTPFWLRLLTYLPGMPMAEVAPSPTMYHQLGATLGKMDKVLLEFDHPAAHRDFEWDLKNAGKTIAQHLPLLTNPDQHALVSHFLAYFYTHVAPALPMLRQSVIHGDANNYNVIIHADQVSLIDFGDFSHTATIFELAIACAYPTLAHLDSLQAARHIVAGYHQHHPLTNLEIELLYYLISLRLATSVVMSAYQRTREPDNAYLSISEQGAWQALSQLRTILPHVAGDGFRRVCNVATRSK